MDALTASPMDTVVQQLLSDVSGCLGQVSSVSLDAAGGLLAGASRIFTAGAGRSALCMRALAMRLMHLGKTAYVVGETITPAIEAGDLLILGSGSGQTAGMRTIAGKARQRGAVILLFTTDGSSPLAEMADHLVLVPAPSMRTSAAAGGLQPMGTLFEQCLLLLCDALVLSLMDRMGIGPAEMIARHANLE